MYQVELWGVVGAVVVGADAVEAVRPGFNHLNFWITRLCRHLEEEAGSIRMWNCLANIF